MLVYAAASHAWRAIPIGLAEWAWQRRGRSLLQRAAREVPACRQLLRIFADRSAADSASIASFVDLPELQTCRRSYLEAFPLDQRCRRNWQRHTIAFDPPAGAVGGRASGSDFAADEDRKQRTYDRSQTAPGAPLVADTYHPQLAVSPLFPFRASSPATRPATIARHSGLGTQDSALIPPFGWPRGRDEYVILRQQLVGLLSGWFDATQRRTLLVLSLPELGWSGRHRIREVLQEAIRLGHLCGSIADLAEVDSRTVLRLSSGFEQCVVLSDPANAATQASWLQCHRGRAGLVVLGQTPPDLQISQPSSLPICSVLGTDEAGPLVALETPFSRTVSRLCQLHPSLKDLLLPGLPSRFQLYQPFPRGPWIEHDPLAGRDQPADLLLTSWGIAPLVRYRVGWSGRIVSFSTVCEHLGRQPFLSSRELRRLTRIESSCWKLPLVGLSS